MEKPLPIPLAVITSGSGFGVRFLASLIDFVLWNTLVMVAIHLGEIVMTILQAVGGVAPGWKHNVIGMGWSPLAICAFLLGYFLYHGCMEGIHGASLGKLICQLRVISVDGRPCNVMQAIQRNLALLLDLQLFGLVGYYSMLKSPLNQRYGDVMAKTVVVSAAKVPQSARRPGKRFFLGFTLGVSCSLFMTLEYIRLAICNAPFSCN